MIVVGSELRDVQSIWTKFLKQPGRFKPNWGVPGQSGRALKRGWGGRSHVLVRSGCCHPAVTLRRASSIALYCTDGEAQKCEVPSSTSPSTALGRKGTEQWAELGPQGPPLRDYPRRGICCRMSLLRPMATWGLRVSFPARSHSTPSQALPLPAVIKGGVGPWLMGRGGDDVAHS